MMPPVVIAIGGAPLTTWTEMTLQRSKDEMTGSLSVTIFAGAMPSGPMVQAAKCGAPVTVYIAGQLAFTGSVDKREGSGTKEGEQGSDAENQKEGHGESQASVNIGPTEYTIKLTCRGKTKRLIDSSHQHPTTNMLKPTTQEVCQKLVEPFKVPLEWKGPAIKLDKVRFRDGARVADELHRIALEYCYFMYETRDGKLKVTDGVGMDGGGGTGGGGDALILGQNILTFSAEQSEDKAKSKIKVKGQRSKKEIHGEKALRKTHKTVQNKSVKDFAPLTVQHYGDADDQTLERRARFEMNKRNTDSRKITIDVFHVQSPSGAPWDVGNCHYVEVPPEGIFDMFECTQLTYHVNAEKELKTTLVLSPPPSGGAGGEGGGGGGGMGGGGGGGGGFGLAALDMGIGAARRSQAGITLSDNTYPDPWTPPMLAEMPFMSLVDETAKREAEEAKKPKEPEQTVPLTLPSWFGETS